MPILQVLFQDEDILVIDKMAGIVVTPADTIQEDTISDILTKEFKIDLDRGGIVHRLDKDTSGVLIVAKTQEALENLQSQFKNRLVKKEYLALVHGEFNEEKTVKGAIIRNPRNREKFIVWEDEDSKEAMPAGRQAQTTFTPIKNLEMPPGQIEKIFVGFSKIQFKKLITIHYSLFTLVSARPMTGRTHQIRVHLKHIGFPVVSDDKYGGRKTVRLDHRWCPRQFLHAKRLEITHPKTGERMVFESPLAMDLKEALEYLEIRN